MKRIIGSLGLITLCWLIGSCGDSPTGPPPPPPPPTTAVVVMSATTSTLVPSQTLQLSATAKDISGQVLSRTFAWTSSDVAKATVSSSGMVSGVAPGTATITAAVDGKSATTSVTVLDGGVVSSIGTTLNLMAGGVQIVVPDSAVLTPINLSVVPSTAFATDPRVVQGTPFDFGPSGTTFAKPVTIKIKYDPARLPTGTEEAALQIHLSVPGWQAVETSTVDTAANVVTAQISHFSTYAILTPLPVASVEIRAPPGKTIVGGVSTLVAGETEQLTAALADAQGQPLSNRAITWATSNASIATITSGGLVTAINPGSTTISATAGGVTSTITVTVTPVPVSSVAVALTPQTITVGQTSQAAAVLKDSKGATLTGRSILWASDNAAVATINSATGVVTAVAPGSATISATSEGQSGTATITVTLVPVASVTVSLASNSINAVETTQATASLHDANGGALSGRTITWSSDNTAVATVSSTGLVTAVSTGSANITATSEGKTGAASVAITPAPVASVFVAPPSGSVVAGSTFQLSAETRDAKGQVLTGRLITWSTDAPGVAVVSATTGLVTAASPGTANITAESENKIGTASITVTAIPVATVNVSLASATVIAGQTTQATATTLDGSGNTLTGRIIVWSSDDASIATVSSTGLVTSHAAGTAHITATSETKTGSALLTVDPVPVATVAVNPPTASVIVGATLQLTATTKDVNGNPLTGRAMIWSSSDNTIATVDQSGLVTAHAIGAATISATSEGKTGSSSITVTPVPVASVTVSLTPNSITAVGTSQAAAVTLDANGVALTGRTITWSSSNTAVATVSAQGVVTAIAEGTANIVATSEGKIGSAVLTVTPAPVASVVVSPPSATVFQSATEQLTVVLKDAHNNVLSGRTVLWSSSNTAVATVSTNGLVTAASGTMGTATITATSEGQTGTSSITVSQVPVATISVTLTPSTINVGQNAQASAILRDASNNVLTGRTVTWTSDNTIVATVSSSGVVTALAAGTAHIFGASGGQTNSATLTVTPIPVASVSVSLAGSPIQIGQTTQATAIARDAGNNVLTGRVVVWSSDNSGVATVNPSGLVTATAAGTANIIATSEGESGNSLLTVIPVPVASLALSAPTTPMVLGQAQQLTAIPKDAGGNTLAGRTVNWVSSNPAVLSVSSSSSVSTSSGATINIAAAGLGTAFITASSESAPSVATPVVTVNPIPVATVTVSPSSATLALGVTPTQQLTATLKDSNNNALTGRTVAWTSSNPSAATVDGNGFVTAVGGGSTTITATSEGKTGTASITVTVPVATVAVSPSSATLSVGVTYQLIATTKDVNGAVLTGRVVTWSSSNATIASVSATGMVTAVATGTAVITATSEGKSGTSSITVTPIPVASVSVSLVGSIQVGQTAQATATTFDASNNVLTGRVVIWSTANSAVATVSSSGLVTSTGVGSTTITATSEGKPGSASLTVIAVPVGSVTVTPGSATVIAGATQQLAAETRDANNVVVTDRQVTWSSSNTAIATVNSVGLVTAVSVGGVTITATSEGKSGTSSITVVPVPVASVTVGLSPSAITAVGTSQATATTLDGNGGTLTGRVVTWSSNNTAVATVSAQGVVTAVSVGTASITATSEGKSGSATITVTPAPVGSVTVSPTSAIVVQGGTEQLSVTLKDAHGNVLTGRTVTWSSSSDPVATVTQGGLVTAVAVGTATITATSEGQSGTSSLTVSPIPVASVTVTLASGTITDAQTTQATAVDKDADGNVLTGRTITWTSDNNAVATVSSTGVVTPVAAGSTQIRATSGGQTGSATLTVIPSVAAVIVSPSSPSVVIGTTLQLAAETRDANNNVLSGRTVTWSSSVPSIATVSATGLVTAVALGSATITATSEGKVGTSSITVVPVPVALVTVSLTSTTITVGQTTQATATTRDGNGNVLIGRSITWSSGNNSIATVSPTGLVTSVSAGSVQIIAMSETKTGSATLTVNPAPVATVALSVPTTPMIVGGTQLLTGTPKDAGGNALSGRTVNWVSSDPTVLSLSVSSSVSTSSGAMVTVTALKVGTATITVSSESAQSATTPLITVNPVPVASVTVTPPTVSLVLGISPTQQLTAVTKDIGGNVLTGRVVTWSSSNPAAASVDASGLVTAVGAGTTTITATSETKTGTSTITVTLAPVNTVTVTPPSPSLVLGVTPTQQLTAVTRDANGNVLTGRAVTWSSSNNAIASVSTTGLVTALAAGGPVTITATSETIAGTSSVTVALAPVNTVTVSPSSASLVVGITPTQQLTATLRDVANNVLTGRVVTWTSSNSAVASVDGNGLVTAVAVGGPVTITGTSETKTGTSSITVALAPVNSVTLSAPATPMLVGGTQVLTAVPKDANNNILSDRTVNWVSSNPSVLSVGSASSVSTSTGATVTLTAVSQGTATITATSESAPPATTPAITVNPVPVATVTVAPASATLILGITPTQQLTATLRDAANNVLTGRTVTWASSDQTVATVDANGLVTAVAAGSATITATSETKTGTSSITVTLAPVNTVTVAPLTAALVLGITPTQQLTATLRDVANNVLTGRVVVWTSNNQAAAIVDASGLVTAVGAGTTTITATSETKTGTSAITVTVAPVNAVTVTPSTATLVLGVTPTQQLTANLTDANGNPLSGRTVEWASSNTAAATVDANGLVTAVAAGTTTITATSESKTGTSSIAVTVAPVNVVAVSPPSANLVVGITPTQQLTATLTDVNNNILSGRTVTWGSSDGTVAAVDANGLVTAVGAGTATITATSETKTGTSSIIVTPAPVNTVTVTPPSASLVLGITPTQQMTATLKDANSNVLTGRTVTWSSSNQAAATVDVNGLVTAVAAGTTTITATSETKTGTSTITVTLAPVASVTLSAPTTPMIVGSTQQLTATTKDENGHVLTGRTITWASSNPSVLTVGASGSPVTVTAIAVGQATITATSESVNSSPTTTVTVIPIPVATVTLSAPASPMLIGASQVLTATPKDGNGNPLIGRTVNWVSSNTAVLTVSSASSVSTTGGATVTVTAAGAGQATITATSETAPSATTPTITVNPSTPSATLLHVSAANRRYFENASGQIVYLTGSHTWSNLQDNGTVDPPPTFDYTAYLDFLVAHNHNFFRLWAWEQSKWTAEIAADYWITPGPFARTGPGVALDGKPKFDLTQFNQAYFDRLRQRVIDAGSRGIYVSVMLFDGWSVGTKGGLTLNNPWKGHPFNAANNINGINGDTNGDGLGFESQALVDSAVTAFEEAYVRRVIDAVGDLDNVLYEIDNEGDVSSKAWQYHMIQVIRDYEATKAKQHPIGMTAMFPGGTDGDLTGSDADWISTVGSLTSPVTADGSKVLISDTDHICGVCGDVAWVWKTFLKGHNLLFMDVYDGAAVGLGAEGENASDPTWEAVRKNMGYARSYAQRMDLAGAVPHGNLVASETTGYMLAKPGSQYLVFIPSAGSVTLDLSAVTGSLNVEWFNPGTGLVVPGSVSTVAGGPSVMLNAPFSGPAVLFLH